jgi:hypothetical protein
MNKKISESEAPETTSWESGITRGKANPVADKDWESGITRGKANPLWEESINGKTLINIDIQPEYKKFINFNIYEWAETINNHDGRTVFLYNGEDTMGMVSENEYRDWLYHDCEISEEVLESALFYDKGYAFFRYCMDSSISDESIVNLIKMMRQYNINDSRELDDEFWAEYAGKYGEDDIHELVRYSDDCITIPELMDFLSDFTNIVICGGGKNECLKEVEIALMALDIPYDSLNKYIFETNDKLNEELITLKNLIKKIEKWK